MDDKIKSLQKNGYVEFRNFWSIDEINKMKKELDIVKSDQYLLGEGRSVNYCENGEINSIQGLTPNKKCYFTDIGKSKKVSDLCKILLNDNVGLRACELFLKPSKVGKSAPNHQDNAMWCLKKGIGLTIWTPLNNSSGKNGGLYYYKGSHLNGCCEHENSYQVGTSQKIKNNDILKNFEKVIFNLKPGDMVVHLINTIHGSSKNTSNDPRQVFTIQIYGKSDEVNSKKKKEYLINLKKQLISRGQELNDGNLLNNHEASDGFKFKEKVFVEL